MEIGVGPFHWELGKGLEYGPVTDRGSEGKCGARLSE